MSEGGNTSLKIQLLYLSAAPERLQCFNSLGLKKGMSFFVCVGTGFCVVPENMHTPPMDRFLVCPSPPPPILGNVLFHAGTC